MSTMNTGRVILGGLVAGVVIDISEYLLNGVVLAKAMTDALSRLNLPPISTNQIAVFLVLGFALGIATIWTYAAIRPRYGPGPKTALCAGALVWFLACVYPGIFMIVTSMFPTQMMLIGFVWGLVELLVAAVAGAAVYQEEAARVGA